MKHHFNFKSYYRALSTTVASRGANWKKVSEETGVSQSTLSRMAKGRQPDAESLTALSAWAGLNPVDFINVEKRSAEPIARVGRLLREDPNLDEEGAQALEEILRTAYARFKRRS